ncbi:hypothetical protein JDO7802_02307 [Jannaschia donghaensis]|uniref:Uncharacterized protein n=1 Tax=Jannaschia donghaensis TaxID=420998 RepID=A0A0M6YLZ1_9RHOB|nr:hypothetical protein JDO7802_02307 [Jannaschia donghaensis]
MSVAVGMAHPLATASYVSDPRKAASPRYTAIGPNIPPAVANRGVAAFLPRKLPFLRITASQTSLAAMAKKKAMRTSFTR